MPGRFTNQPLPSISVNANDVAPLAILRQTAFIGIDHDNLHPVPSIGEVLHDRATKSSFVMVSKKVGILKKTHERESTHDEVNSYLEQRTSAFRVGKALAFSFGRK